METTTRARHIEVSASPKAGLLNVTLTRGAARPRDVQREFHFGVTPDEAVSIVAQELGVTR